MSLDHLEALLFCSSSTHSHLNSILSSPFFFLISAFGVKGSQILFGVLKNSGVFKGCCRFSPLGFLKWISSLMISPLEFKVLVTINSFSGYFPLMRATVSGSRCGIEENLFCSWRPMGSCSVGRDVKKNVDFPQVRGRGSHSHLNRTLSLPTSPFLLI